MLRFSLTALVIFLAVERLPGQTAKSVLLKPARVFDGVSREAHAGWAVLIRGDKIESAGPADEIKMPAETRVLDLPGMTLLPGLIEAHSHLLLHPYNEASWNDQVLKEPLALRVCRATNHARSTLLAGFKSTDFAVGPGKRSTARKMTSAVRDKRNMVVLQFPSAAVAIRSAEANYSR